MKLPCVVKKAIECLDDRDINVIHTVCLGCNARCGLRCKVIGGHVKEISGNPYHPYNRLGSPIPYGTSIRDSINIGASTCGKPLEIDGYCFNERRILVPLKRAGKRGEGKFEPISWEKLIEEISEGGRLFAHIGEDRHVPGLRGLLSDEPIDERLPWLGSKRNKFLFLTGRLQSGRKEFIDRFVKSSFGSINRIGHTDICGLGFRMGNFAFTEGRQVELKADPWNAKYIIVFGANIYEALQPGLNTYGATLAKRHSEGQVRFVIVDPRAQKAGCHAHKWVKIMPGQDGAFVLGMMRRIIEKESYNIAYLQAPNEDAARALGNGAYVNATHLVIWEKGHPRYGRFLRMRDLITQDRGKKDDYVVIDELSGLPCSFREVNRARLFFNGEIDTSDGRRIRVKTTFQIVKEEAFRYPLSGFARLCRVPEEVICEVADEFMANAPYSATCQYHGAGNYVNGTYAAYAIAMLNAFSGSIGRKGGYLASGGGFGSWKNGRYKLNDFPGKRHPSGIRISREKAKFEGKPPAKRPWFPFTKGGLCVEALSGVDEAYPYGIDVLFLYFFNPVYSIPGGRRFISTLKDENKAPLIVSIDIGINESNIYADYIVPDVTYIEGQYGWLSPHAPGFRFTGLRSPAIEPVTKSCDDGRPFCLETFLIDLAKRLDLPGFGQRAIPVVGEKQDQMQHLPLNRAEDFYLRAYANICESAGNIEPDPEATRFVERNYPVARFKDILRKDEWEKLCFALARGGIFQGYEKGFSGSIFRYGPKRFVLYNEVLAGLRCSITGKKFWGSLRYVPPVYSQNRDYPFVMVSYKTALQTQSRTIWHKVAIELHAENHVEMHPEDARALGLGDMDKVRIISPWSKKGVVGLMKISDRVRRGVVAISISYGHSQLGAQSLWIKDASKAVLGGAKVCKANEVIGNKGLGQGVNPNRLSALDPHFHNTPLVDLVGGIPDFSSSCVRIEPYAL